MCYRCRGEACQRRGGPTDPAAAQEGVPLTPSPHRVPAPPGESSGMKWLTPVGGPRGRTGRRGAASKAGTILGTIATEGHSERGGEEDGVRDRAPDDGPDTPEKPPYDYYAYRFAAERQALQDALLREVTLLWSD